MLEKNFLRPLRLLCSYFNQTQYRTEQTRPGRPSILKYNTLSIPFFFFCPAIGIKKITWTDSKVFWDTSRKRDQ